LSQKIEKTALLKSSTVSKLRESFGFILTVGEQFYLPSTCRKKHIQLHSTKNILTLFLKGKKTRENL
jgi:hypothetical protein